MSSKDKRFIGPCTLQIECNKTNEKSSFTHKIPSENPGCSPIPACACKSLGPVSTEGEMVNKRGAISSSLNSLKEANLHTYKHATTIAEITPGT